MSEYDEILEQEAREHFQEMGLDEDFIEETLADLRENGAFNA